MTSAEAKEVLEGIAGLACRLTESAPANYRVKPGGDTNKGTATIDWYLTVQNMPARSPGDADPAINTSAARDGGLRRLTFRIVQRTGATEPLLIISEWTAEKDWLSEYRDVWSSDVTGKSRMEMAQRMAAAIGDFRT